MPIHNPTLLDFRYIEIDSDLSIFDIFRGYGTTTDSFLLDSSKEDSIYSQYSMIGVNPHYIVKYIHGKIYVKDYLLHLETKTEPDFVCVSETDIFSFLNEQLQRYTVENTTGLPFVGGGIGYFSYELSKELEHLPRLATQDYNIPESYYVFYDNVILKKVNSSSLFITGLGILEHSRLSIRKIQTTLRDLPSGLNSNVMDHTDNMGDTNDMDNIYSKVGSTNFVSPFTQQSYMAAVETMRNYIEEGHIYIANMTHTFKHTYTQKPLDTYQRLRHINPAPFSAYMQFEDMTVLCSSPERFLKITNGTVTTRPIKGTIPRGATPEEDEENQRLLMASEKDKSELLMIVDLERNDLSKVCRPGSVAVTELFEIETYATVFHLVATIEGKLLNNVTPIDCIRGTFPGGSITGAPKIRAMEIIEELEPTTRNLYTGCIGYIGYDHNADFNIVIRTIMIHDKNAYIGVGGGITWESDPKSEYDETLQKAKALFSSLGTTDV